MMRRTTPFDWLVVGLGNPGKQYAGTRHNVGEDVVRLLAVRRHDTALKSGRNNALVGESRIGDERAVLAFPLTYVNDSGLAVRSLVRRYRIDDPAQVVVVHDGSTSPDRRAGEGRWWSRRAQRPAQHRIASRYAGLRSGPHRRRQTAVEERGADHVLDRLPARQRELFAVAVEDAADAVEMILAEGPDAAMRRFNVRGPGD